MDHTPTDGQDVPVRKLTTRAQWRLAGLLLALAIVLFWLVPVVWSALTPPPPPPPPPPADGSFVATDKQWQTLSFATAQSAMVGDNPTSEGKIAVDDDLTTTVYSPFTGRVTQLIAKVGDHVRAGQVLFAVAANEAAQSNADIATSAAQVTVARAAEARLHDLYNNQGAALKDWQQAQADLAAAQANLAAAQGRRNALGGVIAKGQGLVRAPVSGIVTQRLIGQGQYVASSTGGTATQAFTISSFDKVWLVGNLREEDAGRAHVGQYAQVRPLGSNEVLHARINYVGPSIDPGTRRLTVRAELPNPDGHLKPETLATFTLDSGNEHPSVTVPEAAVIFEANTARVWVAMPHGHKLLLRQIKTGQVSNGTVEVTGGLRAGEVVVTAGSLFIDRGSKSD
ncbi:efflux RND transporter periplasmic adaptor subunit [Novosphingobium sp.]|uniref:efflux RND transporter periplasmic adaptor subunit n=1 Tax=Novosphingobium sp. TaxID=1874826 RepID=UPI003B525472